MNKLTIVKKLYLGFGLIVAVMLALAVLTGVNFSRLSASTDLRLHSLRLIAQGNAVYADLAQAAASIRSYGFTGEERMYNNYQKAVDSLFKESLPKARAEAAGDPTQAARLDKLQAMADAWIHDFADPFLAKRRAINDKKASLEDLTTLSVALGEKARIAPMAAVLKELTTEANVLNQASKRTNESIQQQTMFFLWSGTALGALIALAVSVMVGRNIAHRLARAVQTANAVANGDLSQRIESQGNDEVGVLLRSLASMRERLVEIIANIQHSAADVTASAEQIASSAQQLSVASHEQSNASTAMAAAVEELTVSISHVSDNAKDAHGLSRTSGELSEQGGAVILSTVNEIREIAETVRLASERMSLLGDHTQQISSIVDVIKDIAEQTNLLALNAAIEAARAGEQGRGFAVVADEVRKLAERTSESTREITGMISQILTGSQDTLAVMQQSVSKVERGVDTANQAGEAIAQIHGSAEKVVGVVTDISTALREQSTVSNQVANNVERIAQMSEENDRAVEEASQAALRLKGLAESLKHSVAFFRVV
ncbi:methyl-accepting chemotaxis protein [Chitinimonas sp.]|uniref:methyl-accepting chemotaxis protein n=1 Tax=Chitinimonas sp. TaxID=1934313 RepID=UPI002F95CE00